MLSFALRAKNSSGLQHLIIEYDEEEKEFGFTLVGEYEDKPIQIDFDSLSTSDMEDLVAIIELRLKNAFGKK